MESRNEAELRRGQCTWAPRLEVEGALVPWDAMLWKSKRGQAIVLVKDLEQPLLLPRDMEGLRRTKQPNLFMSLKKDLMMVSQLTSFFFLNT